MKEEVKGQLKKHAGFLGFIFDFFGQAEFSTGDEKQLNFVLEILDLVEVMVTVGFFASEDDF